MNWPIMACPTCGAQPTSIRSQGGRTYELDESLVRRFWFEPCGHDLVSESLVDVSFEADLTPHYNT